MDSIGLFLAQTGIWGCLAFAVTLIALFFVVRDFKRFFKTRKKLIKQLAELEEKKCKGPHSWIDMAIMGEQTHVCQDCNFSPKHDTFVKEYFVKAELEAIKFKKEMKEYRQKRMDEISEKHDLGHEKLKEISDEVINIEKNFTIKYLSKKIKEMTDKS